jgi:hypothetical protein
MEKLYSVIENGFLYSEAEIIWNIIEFAEYESVFFIFPSV